MVDVIRKRSLKAVWQVGDYVVTEGQNDNDSSVLKCTCGAKGSEDHTLPWCDHISEVVTNGQDGRHGFISQEVILPVRPKSESIVLRGQKVTLARPDDSGVAEMWAYFMTRQVPFQMAYIQERSPNSSAVSVNVGLRLPGEGRMAMRSTLLRFVQYVAPRLVCMHKRHSRVGAAHEHGRWFTEGMDNEGMRVNMPIVENALVILKTGVCIPCAEHDRGPIKIGTGQHDPDLIPDV